MLNIAKEMFMNKISAKSSKTFILLVLAFFIGSNLLPGFVNTASAATAPKAPFLWDSAQHGNMVDASKTVYAARGYACVVGVNQPLAGDGTSISDSAKPTSSKKEVTYFGDAIDGKSTVPTCNNGKAADYVWTTAAGTDMYALVVYGYKNNSTETDAKLEKINNSQDSATIWKISNNSFTAPPIVSSITSIAVDTAVSEIASTADPGTPPTSTDGCYQSLPVFGWILCGAIDLADGLYSGARSWVFGLLNIPEATYSSNSGLKTTWTAVKNLASAGVALVAIVMVASQIFNLEIMSAYTVKKVLPRLIIATIAMQLSWFIFTLLIQFSNAIGWGIYSLLTNAFQSQDIIDILGKTGNTAGEQAIAQTAGVGIVAALGFSASALAGSGVALTVALSSVGVIISILLAIFTIIIRRMLIILLLTLAPLALLAWILPSTHNMWNAWWRLFSRLLGMFPLIAILFAAGNIGASIIVSSGEDQSTRLITAIVVYFAPLFLIPKTYKFAGGMFAASANALGKIGGRAKSSGYFGLREQAKADKEFAKKKNINRAYKTLGEGSKAHFPQRGIARWRTGTISAGIPGTKSKHDFNERLSNVQRQGRVAEFEEGIKHAKDAFSDSKISRLNAVQAAEHLYNKILTANDGEMVDIDGAGTMAENNTYLRRQAMQMMAETRQVKYLRKAQNLAATDSRYGYMNDELQSVVNANYSGLKEKAPDVAAPSLKEALESTTAPSMLTWDNSTWEVWSTKYQTGENRQLFDGQIKDLLSNEQLRTALSPQGKQALRSAGYNPDGPSTQTSTPSGGNTP